MSLLQNLIKAICLSELMVRCCQIGYLLCQGLGRFSLTNLDITPNIKSFNRISNKLWLLMASDQAHHLSPPVLPSADKLNGHHGHRGHFFSTNRPYNTNNTPNCAIFFMSDIFSSVPFFIFFQKHLKEKMQECNGGSKWASGTCPPNLIFLKIWVFWQILKLETHFSSLIRATNLSPIFFYFNIFLWCIDIPDSVFQNKIKAKNWDTVPVLRQQWSS